MSENNFLVPEVKPVTSLTTKLPCPFSASGMLQPSHLQPPPMFGPRGSTIPPRHLAPYAHFKINRPRSRHTENSNYKNHNQQNRWNSSDSRHQHKSYKNQSSGSPQRYQGSREFWCEPCDKDFKTHEMLLEHKSEHQKCGIDGCKFEGHELIVTKHIKMQHSTGLFERLKNLETPEDILKWREERKKRYPTKSNIELRQQIQIERNNRGEKLNDSKARFGRKSNRKSWNNRPKDNNRTEDINKDKKSHNQTSDMKKDGNKRRRRPNKKVVSNVEPFEDVKNDDGSDSNNGLPRFKGTSQLKCYMKRKDVQPKNVLVNMLGMYGSDSDSNDEYFENSQSTNETEPMEMESLLSKNSENVLTEEYSKSEDLLQSNSPDHQSESCLEDLPCEEPILKEQEAAINITQTIIPETAQKQGIKSLVNKRISKRTTIMDLSKKYRNQNTMLEKLLQKEIRHERNVLLQCVRHVVKEKFFGIGEKPRPK